MRFAICILLSAFLFFPAAVYLSIWLNNGTAMDAQNPLTTACVGESVTPSTGLNTGFSMYEVNSETFDVMEAYTWFLNVSAFPELDNQAEVGAAYHFEYSTHEAYGGNFTWPDDAPLMCTSTACQEAKVCYMRSGSPPIAARCTKGFGIVQN
ncbi:hypothetical protein JB92DRAFT_3101150 [Gautieria morchelliformis]|nr:hypothetical protein JB92DRAFT_3101150 [Gautieria morchelliformis]